MTTDQKIYSISVESNWVALGGNGACPIVIDQADF
jgi:hypothetical protein